LPLNLRSLSYSSFSVCLLYISRIKGVLLLVPYNPIRHFTEMGSLPSTPSFISLRSFATCEGSLIKAAPKHFLPDTAGLGQPKFKFSDVYLILLPQETLSYRFAACNSCDSLQIVTQIDPLEPHESFVLHPAIYLLPPFQCTATYELK
jgi:hypothetical protein